MKFLKLAKLGHRNLIHHKKQTIFTIIVVGSLFSVLVAIQLVMQGLENFYIKQNLSVFNGSTYIAAQACRRSELLSVSSTHQCVKDDGKFDEQCLKNHNQKPAPCSTNQQQVNALFANRTKPYGGEVIGNVEIRNYQYINLYIYPQEIFTNNITADLSNKPQDALATIVTIHQAASLLEIRMDRIESRQAKLKIIDEIKSKAIGKIFTYNDQKIFIAGILPYGAPYISVARHERDMRPLDWFLHEISVHDNITNNSGLILINDKSPAINKVLTNSTLYAYQALIKFDSPDRACDYFRYELDYVAPSLFGTNRSQTPQYMVNELSTNSVKTQLSFEFKRFTSSFAIYVLLVTAVIIIVFTFLRLVTQDSRLIALYRSLGATASDVWFIYLWYVFELCLLTVAYALIIGILLALSVSKHYSIDFNIGASLFYIKHITEFVPFIGFNLEIVKIIGAILLAAPITSILTLDQLSMRNIARRLKKQ